MTEDRCSGFSLGSICISNKIDLAVFIPILVGVIGYLFSEYSKYQESKHNKVKVLVALRVEIELNVKGLIRSLDNYPSFPTFSAFVRADVNNRPVTSTYYTSVVYKAITSSLTSLPISLIDGIISFYSELDQISETSSTYDRIGFCTISPEGKESIHQDIVSKMKVAIEKGEGVKRQLALILPSKV